MTKILIFSTAYFPFVGGAEVAVREITDRLGNGEFSAKGGPAFGWDMITARMDRKLPKRERIGNINVYRMGFGLAFLDKIILAKFGFLKALKLDKKNNYDIAWSIMASQASIAASLFSAIGGSALGGKINKSRRKKIKLVLTLQEGDEEEHLARYVFNIKFLYKLLIRPWHRLVFKKADKVTAISNYLKERGVRNGVKVPIEIIPNGVDIANYQLEINNYELSELRKKINIKEDEKVLITTSRLVKKNAIGDIIEAMKYLPDNIKFLILGIGPLEDEIKSQVKKLGLKDRIIFLGQVDNKEIPKYLKISDIFVRSSLSEGLGNSFLEAMAAGIPVIGTPVGGIPDFLKDGETGWFCEVNNPKSIAEKIKYILDEKNKEEVERVKENGKKLVKEKYNWEIIAKKMNEILKS